MKLTPHKIRLVVNSLLAVFFVLIVIVLLETSRSGSQITFIGHGFPVGW